MVDVTEFGLNLLGFIKFYWVLPSFREIYLFFFSFTVFYLVLLGLIEFYQI